MKYTRLSGGKATVTNKGGLELGGWALVAPTGALVKVTISDGGNVVVPIVLNWSVEAEKEAVAAFLNDGIKFVGDLTVNLVEGPAPEGSVFWRDSGYS